MNRSRVGGENARDYGIKVRNRSIVGENGDFLQVSGTKSRMSQKVRSVEGSPGGVRGKRENVGGKRHGYVSHNRTRRIRGKADVLVSEMSWGNMRGGRKIGRASRGWRRSGDSVVGKGAYLRAV